MIGHPAELRDDRRRTIFPPEEGTCNKLRFVVIFITNIFSLFFIAIEEAKDEPLESVRVSASETKVTVTGLNPGTTYVFKVYAENTLGRSGPSQDLTITTEEEAPSNSPQDVKVVPLSSSMVKVTWKGPSPSSLGYLLGYYVGYRDLSSNDPFVYKTVDISKQQRLNEALISNLRRNTKYAITVQGYNSKGAGPASKEVIVQTLQHGTYF
ncbi:down syndrome cell adhesion molecule [Trichonephila clavata]|uniref:Down syndrome cell adhesion molecule n=1 Tax=Trichonephila clavata TaxID=2740835 RepID=A0A8X6HZ27_TRICU|nr:down syndrome cell adhesion molecule [Trichonephila clavata]